MGFISFVGSVMSAVSSGVSSAWNKAKELGGRALSWMAEKAEGFVGKVKDIWAAAKPFVTHIRTALKIGAAALGEMYPPIATALLVIERGLGKLVDFEKSPILRYLNEAFEWIVNFAKRRYSGKNNDTEMSPEDIETAKRHQENMRTAETVIDDEDTVHSIQVASLLNDYAIAMSDLDSKIRDGVTSFEEYLRLRAGQKLLSITKQKITESKSVSDITLNDILLVRIASNLLREDPTLKDKAASQLDKILREKYGKTLMSFVFEEIIVSWKKTAEDILSTWHEKTKRYSKDMVLYKKLVNAKKLQNELPDEEESIILELEKQLPIDKAENDSLDVRFADLERYSNAAEGLIQYWEKDYEQFITEGRDYLIETSSEVSEILMHCAQHDTPFSSLTEQQQRLINDYANIFMEDSLKREKSIMEILA